MIPAMQPRYRRLPGRSKKFWAFLREECQLWLGPDHLLHIRRVGFSETFKRFEFKDIQAITVCQTRRWIWIALFLFSVITAMILLYIKLSGLFGDEISSADRLWSAWMPALPLIVVFGVNLLYGPTCTTTLHTAVQIEELTAQGRRRAAYKTLDILRPLIEASQGRLGPDDLEVSSPETVTIQPSRHVLRSSALSTTKPGSTQKSTPFGPPASGGVA